MGLFEHFPYTNFHSLNIEWAIEKIKELLQQGETLYGQLQQWKTDTDAELDAWKTQTLADLETWESNLTTALETWKGATVEEFEEQFAEYQAAFDAIKDDAEAAALSAASSASNAATSAAAAATTLASSLAFVKNLSASDDIDTIFAPGVYLARNSASVPAHSPTVAPFVLLVMGSLDGSATPRRRGEILINSNGSVVTRWSGNNEVWGEWVNQAKESAVTTLSDALSALTTTVTGISSDLATVTTNVAKALAFIKNTNSSDDIDTIFAPGVYLARNSASVPANSPTPVPFVLLVMGSLEGSSSPRRRGEILINSNGSVWTRWSGDNESWGSWVPLSKKADVDALATTVSGLATDIDDLDLRVRELENSVYDVPTSQGIANIIKRSRQMIDISFEAAANLLLFNTRHKDTGETQKGIPYSSVRPENLYVPNAVNYQAYMTAAKNPNSYLYKKRISIPNYVGRTYYGAVCSSYVAHCYGIDNALPTTVSFDTYPGFEALPAAEQNVDSLRLGYCLNKSNVHIVIVTGIKRNRLGSLLAAEISESTNEANATTRARWLERSHISSYLNNGYVIYKYTLANSVTYTPTPWVHVDSTETDTPTYNTHLFPRRGDMANWPAGQDIEIDLVDASAYTGYKIMPGSITGTITGNVITIPSMAAGEYSLVLTSQSADSDPVYFTVIETAGTAYEMLESGKVRVTPYSSLGTMASVAFCNNNSSQGDFLAVQSFHVFTDQEVTQGYADLDVPVDAQHAPNGVWLMRCMYTTPFGLYSGQLTAVDSSTTGTTTEAAYSESQYITAVT